jgi:branched-chain amino acid transport system permease protein
MFKEGAPSMEQVVNGGVLAAIYVLFAIGVGFPWGTLNVLNLAHGSIFMFSVFICSTVTSQASFDIPIYVAALICIVAGAALEIALELLVFRTIRARAADPQQAELSILIASTGIAGSLVALVILRGGQSFQLTKHPPHVGTYSIFGTQVSSVALTTFVIGFGLAAALALWLSRSRNGRALRAVAVDREASELMGISVSRLSLQVMIISGGLAGLAGALAAVYLGNLGYDSGADLLLKGFAVVVLGGVGSIWGTIIGGTVLAIGETIVTATTSGLWSDGVAFGIIIVILLVFPNGLFGRVKVDRA